MISVDYYDNHETFIFNGKEVISSIWSLTNKGFLAKEHCQVPYTVMIIIISMVALSWMTISHTTSCKLHKTPSYYSQEHFKSFLLSCEISIISASETLTREFITSYVEWDQKLSLLQYPLFCSLPFYDELETQFSPFSIT